MLDVVWFKRDLRVHDHAPLLRACARGNPVLPLYIYEPDLWAQPELSGRQFDFLQDCLDDLDLALRKRGAYLFRRVGDAIETLAKLHREQGIAAIHAHEETGLMWTYVRDKAVRAWARKQGIPVYEHRQHGVWRGPSTRNGWASRWDKMMGLPPLPAPDAIKMAELLSEDVPTSIDLGMAQDQCAQRQIGGRRAGIEALGSFLQTRGRFYRKAMSSPAEGAQACSRISAHLAFGALSMREALQTAQRAQIRHSQEGDADYCASIQSFIARLHWHCHFMQKLEDQPEIEFENFHPSYQNLRPIGPDHDARALAWIEGRTGFPFVDACMRSLAATGWLNFRMRAMVMSFSSYHLWQDWRRPAQLLARQFTDFEPSIHFSQVQMQSGTTGINTARIYNPIKQSTDQDPDGAFIRTWVPELAHLPTPLVHQPWLAPTDLLLGPAANQNPDSAYPARLVDHIEAAAFARTQIYQVRGQPAHKPAARAIQAQHGSRKSGIAQVGRRSKKPQVSKVDATQASFEF
jgi:deoxyribodipyrimidine photo-lyase